MKIAILLTTFLRDKLLEDSLISIKKNYNSDWTILIADQNEVLTKDKYYFLKHNIKDFVSYKHHKLPFDCGLSKARNFLVQDAHAKALELARAAGVGLGRPVRIEETRYTPTPYLGATVVDRAEAAPIEPGAQKVAVAVVLHYRIE